MNLTQDEWATELQKDTDAVVLDVRTEDEYNDGYITNAMNLDIYKPNEFMEGLQNLDKDKSYYVYCKGGSRSQQACHIMSELGFKKAYNLTGGITKWEGEITHP